MRNLIKMVNDCFLVQTLKRREFCKVNQDIKTFTVLRFVQQNNIMLSRDTPCSLKRARRMTCSKL